MPAVKYLPLCFLMRLMTVALRFLFSFALRFHGPRSHRTARAAAELSRPPAPIVLRSFGAMPPKEPYTVTLSGDSGERRPHPHPALAHA